MVFLLMRNIVINYKRSMIRWYGMFLQMLWLCGLGCVQHRSEHNEKTYYVNPIRDSGSEPWATYVNGTYYYTEGYGDQIVVWQTDDITDLKHARSQAVWFPKESESGFHLWAPEIHRIDGKWYIYFTADDGNTDNHHLYVIENSAEDPFDGKFVMKGKIQTDPEDNWGIHASVFTCSNEWYLIWSGWQFRRVDTEHQCIYIAKLENPWTISSPRVMISQPDREWERQWINPDGTRTAYPIYVNEAPQALFGPAGDKVFIVYSASGNWTPYYSLGLLWATIGDELLAVESWHKVDTPVFVLNEESGVYSVGSFCPVPSPDGTETYFLYQARDLPNDPSGALDSKSPRLQKLDWDNRGFPVFGTPAASGIRIEKPSGIN